MNLEKTLQAVAKKHGVSEAEVRRDIQAAIDEGRKSQDPKVIAYWKLVPCKGETPTIEEVIAHLFSDAKSRTRMGKAT